MPKSKNKCLVFTSAKHGRRSIAGSNRTDHIKGNPRDLNAVKSVVSSPYYNVPINSKKPDDEKLREYISEKLNYISNEDNMMTQDKLIKQNALKCLLKML